MHFNITTIEFDWDLETNYALTRDDMNETIEDVLSREWQVESEEDLADAISDHSGFCVKSLDYYRV